MPKQELILCLRHKVKRNLSTSFGEQESPPSPSKSLKRDTENGEWEIKQRTCKKYLNLDLSISKNDCDESLVDKRKTRSTRRSTINYEQFFYDTPSKKDMKISQYSTPVKNRTVSNVRTPRTPKNTPKSTIKLIHEGRITPKVQDRRRNTEANTTPLMKARTQLHVSYIPLNLPCREKEYADILNFLEGKLLDECGGCMYISGVPGTGKTATVTSVINYLLKASEQGDVPTFQYVNVNGMKLTEPRQAYVEVIRQLTGKTVTWEHAQTSLENMFTKKSKKEKLPIVLVIDELDIICTKRQDVVYNLLDWPSKSISQLVVVTIANTMDLPERILMNRVTSRLGLTRLTFQAYTHKQLQEIVTKRLVGTDSFNPDAVQLVARKVASVSGDARRALDICRRAAEIAETGGEDTLVTMFHVNEALKAMVTQPKVRAIKNCSRLEQYVLQAVISEVERTGIEETVFADVYKMFSSLAPINGFRKASATVVLGAVSRLSACRILLVDQKSNDLNQRIILNVSADDVYYALKEE